MRRTFCPCRHFCRSQVRLGVFFTGGPDMVSMAIARGLYAALLVASASAQTSFTKVKAESQSCFVPQCPMPLFAFLILQEPRPPPPPPFVVEACVLLFLVLCCGRLLPVVVGCCLLLRAAVCCCLLLSVVVWRSSRCVLKV